MAGSKKRVSSPAKKPRRVAVTREELVAELERFATKEDFATLDAKIDSVKEDLTRELERFATKEDLDGWGNRMMDVLEERFRKLLDKELGRHVRSSEERMRIDIGAVDDKYEGLSERVAALEARGK